MTRGRRAIVRGVPTSASTFPFVVQIVDLAFGAGFKAATTIFCGGTLVSERFVLTAAHCVEDFVRSPGALRVVIGRTAIFLGGEAGDEGEEIAHVRTVILHPEYRDSVRGHDVALLAIAPRREGTLPRPPGVALYAGGWERRRSPSLLVVGHGSVDAETVQVSTSLRFAPVATYDRDMCGEVYTLITHDALPPSVGCVYDDVHDACYGDSGSGLLFAHNGTFVQAGVVSWGLSCGVPNVPGYYARFDASVLSFLTGHVPSLRVLQNDSGAAGEGCACSDDCRSNGFLLPLATRCDPLVQCATGDGGECYLRSGSDCRVARGSSDFAGADLAACSFASPPGVRFDDPMGAPPSGTDALRPDETSHEGLPRAFVPVVAFGVPLALFLVVLWLRRGKKRNLRRVP